MQYCALLDCVYNGIHLYKECSLTHWGLGCRNASVNCVIIASGNGLLPVRCQAITWTKCSNVVTWPPRNMFQWNLNPSVQTFSFIKCIWKCLLQGVGHFVPASVCWTGAWNAGVLLDGDQWDVLREGAGETTWDCFLCIVSDYFFSDWLEPWSHDQDDA